MDAHKRKQDLFAEEANRLSVLLARTQATIAALPLTGVVETMRPLSTRPISGMPPFVWGVAIIRGAPVPVVNLSLLLRGSKGEEITRFVTLRAGGRLIALAVEQVIGVHELEAAALEAMPPLIRDVQPDIVTAIGVLDHQLLMVLESSRIIPDELWQALDAGGAAP
ncbi:MAG: chemotaxis protein CheW [Gammaproteobacteria bacterium]